MSGWDERHGPARISAGVAVGAAGVAGVAGFGGSGWSLALAPLGVALVVGGLWWSRPRVLAVGCAALFAAAVLAGLASGGPFRGVVVVASTFVAWDLGEHAITLGRQLGHQADTWRLEALHVAGVLAVTSFGVGLVVLPYLLAGGGQPVLALVLFLAGAAAILAALHE